MSGVGSRIATVALGTWGVEGCHIKTGQLHTITPTLDKVWIGNEMHRRFKPMLHTDEVDDRLHEWAETPTHSSDSGGACTPPPPKSKAWNPWSKRADQEGLLPDHFSESKDRKLGDESEIEYDLDGGDIWGKEKCLGKAETPPEESPPTTPRELTSTVAVGTSSPAGLPTSGGRE